MKHVLIAVTMMLAFATAGCMSTYYGQYERDESVQADTLPQAMTKEDIVALTKDGISNQLIIDQIKATQGYFVLNAYDIIELKKAGVSDSVLSVMINSAEPQKTGRIGRRYYSYPSYYGYPYYYPYGYPWYSSLYFGLSYGHHHHYPSFYGHGSYGGHYGGGHYSGSHYGGQGYSGGHGSGGHRSFGSHR